MEVGAVIARASRWTIVNANDLIRDVQVVIKTVRSTTSFGSERRPLFHYSGVTGCVGHGYHPHLTQTVISSIFFKRERGRRDTNAEVTKELLENQGRGFRKAQE